MLDEVPERDCDAWARLSAEGMVLLGHLHTHEFACGGTTDQVGNPWALERSAGGSSGGSAAALASRQVPAATGTDTAGSLRIPSAECGTSTIKPTRGLVSMRGIVPLSPTFDHAGPMTRTVRDCEPLLAALAGVDPPRERGVLAPLRRLSADRRVSTRTSPTGSSARSSALPGERVEPPAPAARLDLAREFFDLVLTEMLPYHRRFEHRRDDYRFSNRARLEHAEQRAMTAEEYVASQSGRAEDTAAWLDWFAEHRIDAIVEPTIPIVAPLRGTRLRGAVRRSRRPLADALLGLDGVPGGCAPHRRRQPERPADERLARRRTRARTGISSHGARRCRTNSGTVSP